MKRRGARTAAAAASKVANACAVTTVAAVAATAGAGVRSDAPPPLFASYRTHHQMAASRVAPAVFYAVERFILADEAIHRARA